MGCQLCKIGGDVSSDISTMSKADQQPNAIDHDEAYFFKSKKDIIMDYLKNHPELIEQNQNLETYDRMSVVTLGQKNGNSIARHIGGLDKREQEEIKFKIGQTIKKKPEEADDLPKIRQLTHDDSLGHKSGTLPYKKDSLDEVANTFLDREFSELPKLDTNMVRKISVKATQLQNVHDLSPRDQSESPRKDNITKRISKEDIRLIYKFEKVLGAGAYGLVHIASKYTHEIATSNEQLVAKRKFAIKSISREKLTIEDDIEGLENEIQIMLQADHPNIVKLYECYLDHKYVHLVQERAEGCNLEEFIAKKTEKGYISNEKEAAHIIEQVLQALAHMHELKICHRDMKLENLLYKQDIKQVKLIDFGLSQRLNTIPTDDAETLEKMQDIAGTLEYMAPEVFEGDYSLPCDLWSVGGMTYCLLAGRPPFMACDEDGLIDKIKCQNYTFQGIEGFDTLKSYKAQNFIERLLEPNVAKRMTIQQALEHKWITDNIQHTEMLTEKKMSVLKHLKTFKAPTELQKHLLKIFINIVDPAVFENMKNTFQAVDVDNSGIITKDELFKEMLKIKKETKAITGWFDPEIQRTRKSVNKAIEAIDFDHNGEIGYTEFLSGCLSPRQMSPENLQLMFEELNIEEKGYISPECLMIQLKRQGTVLTIEEVTQMFKENGLEQDNCTPQKLNEIMLDLIQGGNPNQEQKELKVADTNDEFDSQ